MFFGKFLEWPLAYAGHSLVDYISRLARTREYYIVKIISKVL